MFMRSVAIAAIVAASATGAEAFSVGGGSLALSHSRPSLALATSNSRPSYTRQAVGLRMAEGEEKAAEDGKAAAGAEEVKKSGSQQFDLKKTIDKSGAGFNQFDPVLSATSFVSRRFGLVGGLAVVALLGATEGREIVAALFEEGPKPGNGEIITMDNGLKYEDLLLGPVNTKDQPGPGKLMAMNVEVTIADQTFKKALSFKYGQRPFSSVTCEGLEQGIIGMRVGGRRKITVPVELGPANVKLPPGIPLIYDVTLTEVFENYL